VIYRVELKTPSMTTSTFVRLILHLCFILAVVLLLDFFHQGLQADVVTPPAKNDIPAHWHELKMGMTKDEVRALIGAPNSTNVFSGNVVISTSIPPNPAREKKLAKRMEDATNYEIWSYYGTITINPANPEAAGSALTTSVYPVGKDGKLIGHSIKFNREGIQK
jgi:hypothetical protein